MLSGRFLWISLTYFLLLSSAIFCDYYNPTGECEWHYEPCGKPCMMTCKNPTGVCFNKMPALEGKKTPMSIMYLMRGNGCEYSKRRCSVLLNNSKCSPTVLQKHVCCCVTIKMKANFGHIAQEKCKLGKLVSTNWATWFTITPVAQRHLHASSHQHASATCQSNRSLLC